MVRAVATIAALTALCLAPAASAAGGEWLAGDLHVHTCHSHDAWCPPEDDNTGPEQFYTWSLDVNARFKLASLRGLDYLAITDHDDTRSVTSPGFGGDGVIGVPGYENSIGGHAQMLGATRVYPKEGTGSARAQLQADLIRADGGVFQANHPGYKQNEYFDDCGDTASLTWPYGYEVQPDTLELWNPTAPVQPAELYWECWLARGARIGATGGSDSHWLSTEAVQGPGNPTTWVFAADRSTEAVLAAIRAGRTSVSKRPPILGGEPLVIEADADRDGTFELAAGTEVPPGSPMRVSGGAGFLRIRANGATIVEDALLLPTRAVTFDAPADGGWVRAALFAIPGTGGFAMCDPMLADAASFCPYDQLLVALTSPAYLVAPQPDPDPDPGPGPGGGPKKDKKPHPPHAKGPKDR